MTKRPFMRRSRHKFVVFTVLTGQKEWLGNPFPRESRGFERICFTDDRDLRSEHWCVVPIEGHSLEPERESRRPKLLPHRFLADFDWSIYIDGTVRFSVHPGELLRKYAGSTTRLACFRHPWRDCIYEEAEEVIRLGLDDERRVREQIDHYRSLGYPARAGLIAATVLLRRHNDDDVIALHEEWYDHVLRFSRRDQLSFNFVAWRRHFTCDYFHGALPANDFIKWPVTKGNRVPGDFEDDVYTWLTPEVAASGMTPREHYIRAGASQGLPYSLHRSELVRLANKFRTDKGTLYFNAHGYAFIYDHYLRHLRGSRVRLLELGLLRHDVQARSPGSPLGEAPSLHMWREYFPNAEIIGFDIADFSQVPDTPGVTIVRGDVGSSRDLDRLVEIVDGPLDVIVDDASHASQHQQFALARLFPCLRDGGYYFIEDLTYQPPDLEAPDAPKTLDVLKKLSSGELPTTPYMSEDECEYLRQNIELIEFHDSRGRQFGDIGTDALAAIKKKVVTTTR